MTSQKLHVVLGANGGVGFALTQELVKRGAIVRSVDRSLPKHQVAQEAVVGDALSYESLLQACQKATVIYHCLGVPYPLWDSFFPAANKNVIAVAKAVGAKVVYTDNLYSYSEDASMPLTEASPTNPGSIKGKLRKKLADELMDANAHGVPVAICRAAEYFGPAAPNSYINRQVFERITKGKSAQLVGAIDVPRSFSYIKDFAVALAACGDRDEAFGHIWHVPGMAPMTVRDFVTKIYKQLGQEPKMSVISPFMLTLLAPFVPDLKAIRDIKTHYTQPFTYDWSKFEKTFGPVQTTPLEKAIEETLHWYQQSKLQQ